MVLAVSVLAVASFRGAMGQAKAADDAGARQCVANYIDGFNHHDAKEVAMAFAEDADRTTVRGDYAHGREELEKSYAGLFSGRLKNAVRTAKVTRVRWVAPGVAVVDADWEMTGAVTETGAPAPAGKGFIDLVATKVKGAWKITVFHEAQFPAAPAPAK